MFLCRIPVPPKIILRKAVLIPGGMRASHKHTSLGIWRWGRAMPLGEILRGSMRKRELWGLGPSQGPVDAVLHTLPSLTPGAGGTEDTLQGCSLNPARRRQRGMCFSSCGLGA